MKSIVLSLLSVVCLSVQVKAQPLKGPLSQCGSVEVLEKRADAAITAVFLQNHADYQESQITTDGVAAPRNSLDLKNNKFYFYRSLFVNNDFNRDAAFELIFDLSKRTCKLNSVSLLHDNVRFN